jgi:alpha-L-arabinofuranosidase
LIFNGFYTVILRCEKRKVEFFLACNCNKSVYNVSNIQTTKKQKKMKTTIYTIAMIFLGTGVSLANPIVSNGDETKKEKTEKTENPDSAASKETTFVTSYAADSRQLTVNVTGTIDPYASVSITNQRGAALLCSFIQDQSGAFNFDLSKLEKGIYNVMLITDQEIRIKRITVE